MRSIIMLGTFTRRIGRRDHRSRRFFRPQLIVLEDRVAPAAFTVNTSLDTNATDLTMGTDNTGHVSLRSAIQAANHLGQTNTISLPAGTYDLKLGEIPIKNNLTLTGMGASKTTISAQLTSRIFQVFSGFTVAISNVTMGAGQVQGAAGSLAVGGAILDSGALTLTSDTLSLNFAIGGAGTAGSPGANGADGTMSTPATNGSTGGTGGRGGDARGGAIYLDNSVGAALSIVNCSFTDNLAFQGQGGTGGQGGLAGNAGAFVGGSGAKGGVGGSGGRGGNAFGGAIYNAGATLIIQRSLFSGNFAGVSGILFGTVVGGGTGGVGGAGGHGDIQNGGFEGFSGDGGQGGFGGDDSGGAIYNSSSGRVAITTSSFSQNSAIGETGGQGGAGGVGRGQADIGLNGGTGGPAGDASGGAIDNQGTMTIDSSSLFSNQATGNNGGPGGVGGMGGNADPNIQGSAAGDGGNGGNGGVGGAGFAGAIESVMGSLTLTHSTVSLNSAGPGAGGRPGAGGAGGIGVLGPNGIPGGPGSSGAAGVASDGGIQSVVLAKSQLLDTIVAGDKAPVNPDVIGHFSSLGHNLIGNAAGSSGFTAPGDQVGTTAQPIDPMLGPAGNHGGPTPTMVPQLGSPAIDAGDGTNAPARDQRGAPRIADGDQNVDSDGPVIDIGAVEFQPTDVSIAAQGFPGSVSPGGAITYTLIVSTNIGDNDVTKLALSDSVPAQTTFESFTAPAGWVVTLPAVGQTGTVTASLPSLGPKATASFTLTVQASTKPSASSTTNTATISTASPDPTLADNTATVTTTLLPASDFADSSPTLTASAPGRLTPTEVVNPSGNAVMSPAPVTGTARMPPPSSSAPSPVSGLNPRGIDNFFGGRGKEQGPSTSRVRPMRLRVHAGDLLDWQL
jgi:uncharacterized repeat protein (TIGR01451 family)